MSGARAEAVPEERAGEIARKCSDVRRIVDAVSVDPHVIERLPSESAAVLQCEIVERSPRGVSLTIVVQGIVWLVMPSLMNHQFQRENVR